MGRPKGLPKTGGRQKGARNKATAELKDLAQEYTGDAVDTLAEIMSDDKAPHAARVAAANAILDRGHGKPHQDSTVTHKSGDFASLNAAERARLRELATRIIASRGQGDEQAGQPRPAEPVPTLQ